MLHRPLRRPLAAVLLLSLLDYALWNWSLGAGHDIVALAAGLTLIPLLIAFTWLLLRGATRLTADIARRTRESAAARAQARTAAPRRRRAAGARLVRAGARGAARSVAARATAQGASARGTRGGALARSSAHGRRVAPGAGDQDAATAGASSSKLAA